MITRGRPEKPDYPSPDMTVRAFFRGLRAARAPLWQSIAAPVPAAPSERSALYPRWNRRMVAFLSALLWTGMTLPMGCLFFFHFNIRGSETYDPPIGILVSLISIAGAMFIYWGGRIGALWLSVPLAIWAEELVRAFIAQQVWRHGDLWLFLFPVVLMIPFLLMIVSWRHVGWLRDKETNQSSASTR